MLIVCFVLLLFLPMVVQASQTISVAPQTKKVINVSLSQGDFVNGTVSVSGGSGGGVDFLVSDPNGKELVSYNYTTYTSFSFPASINGTYLFSFDNSFCSCTTGKTVTLDYSVNDKVVQGSLQGGSNEGGSIVIPIILVIGAIAILAVAIITRRLRANTHDKTVSS